MYYYFAFAYSDPMRSSFEESEIGIEEMRNRFIGEWIQTGDEPHDTERVADIWTYEQAHAYYND